MNSSRYGLVRLRLDHSTAQYITIISTCKQFGQSALRRRRLNRAASDIIARTVTSLAHIEVASDAASHAIALLEAPSAAIAGDPLGARVDDQFEPVIFGAVQIGRGGRRPEGSCMVVVRMERRVHPI